MLLPLLPFGFLQWQNISSKLGLGTPKPFSTDAVTFESMATQYATACPPHTFKTHIFSTDPLIIYVEEYLSKLETEYLLNLAVPYYRQSPVSKGYVLEAYDSEIRSSMSAVMPDDPVVSCIGTQL
jgi:prolyl 4-hydroxylase